MADSQQSDNTSNSEPTIWSVMGDMFAAPQKAFKDMEQDYPIIVPLGLVLGLNVAVILFMFANLDISWYIDQLASASDDKQVQESIRKSMSIMSPNTMSIVGAASAFIMLLFAYTVIAMYLVIISNINNDGYQFKQWFSFVTLTALPTLVSILAAFTVIAMSQTGQFMPEAMDPLSLNALIFEMDPTKGLGAILASTSVTLFWSVTLMTIGYRQWTGKSYATAFFIVVMPYVVLYAIRFLML